MRPRNYSPSLELYRADLFKAVREALGLSVIEVAVKAGVSQPTVYAAEDGRDMTAETFKKISDALGVERKHFFNRTIDIKDAANYASPEFQPEDRLYRSDLFSVFREAQGWTVPDLEIESLNHHRTINNVESENNVYISSLASLAAALDVDLMHFFDFRLTKKDALLLPEADEEAA